jgi:hypothetical protein
MHVLAFAAALAWEKTGNRIAAKMAMIATTTRSSMSVNAFLTVRQYMPAFLGLTLP